MRTFIVPTDFSHNARHASAYAVQLALQLKAQILLIHVYEAPVAVSEYSVSELHFEKMKEVIEKQLENRKQELELEYGKEVPIRILALNADLVGNIQKLYENPESRLVVIGLTGAGMANFFLGSNTLNIVHNVGRIVLTVPPFTKFRPIRKVVFACDMQNVTVTVPAERIKRIMKLLDAQLLVLNIIRKEAATPEGEAEKEKLTQMLEGISFSFHTISQNDIIEGIKDFAQEQTADLIAIIPRKRDFLENLLRPNHTKAMLFKSNIPILTLPEGE